MRPSLPLSPLPPAEGEASSRQIINFFAIVAAVFTLGLVSVYLRGLSGSWPFPQDQAGYVFGRDFLNTWFFGKAAFLADAGRFYDHATYMTWIKEVVPGDISNHLWSYPPSFFFLAAPFGLLPYPWALAAWSAAGLITLYTAVRGQWRQTLAILCSPAAVFCLMLGQVSFFMAAITLTALRLLDRRPLIAGSLIALCTIKPQLGLLFPVLLIASRRWQALAVAAGGTVLLVLATNLVWGFSVWRDYVLLGLPAQVADMQDWDQALALAPWSPTVTAAMTMLGLKPPIATLVQIGFTALAALLVAIGCRRKPMDARTTALFLACSIFATPYLLVHDLVAMSAASVILATSEPLDRRGALAVKAMFLLPMLQMAFGLASIPGIAAIPVAFALWALRSKRKPPSAGPITQRCDHGGEAGLLNQIRGVFDREPARLPLGLFGPSLELPLHLKQINPHFAEFEIRLAALPV
jgi:hypothetical protein